MSNYPVALITAIAAGRDGDLLTQLAGTLEVWQPGVLRVTTAGQTARFMYKRVVSASGVDVLSIPARPSSGTGGLWHLWIIQPYDDMPASWVKAFRDKLATWASTRQPTGGKWHLLGPYSPAAFRAAAPAAAWDAVVASWWTIWRAESSPDGVAAQQAQTDSDLED